MRAVAEGFPAKHAEVMAMVDERDDVMGKRGAHEVAHDGSSNRPVEYKRAATEGHGRAATDEYRRAATEDDDGYDPYSDRPAESPLFEEDLWR